MPKSNKTGRLCEDMKREVIAIVSQMKDPRLDGLVTITRVDVTPDLAVAKIYVSRMGENGTKQAVDALKHAAGHVRSEIAKRMHIRKAPEMMFIADDGAQYAAHINEIIESLKK